MSQQNINVGTVPNDGTGDKVRIAFQKVNANFTELYANTKYKIVSSNYTVLEIDNIIYTETSAITITLLTAVGISGKQFTITNGSSDVITLNTTSSQTISGNLTISLRPYDSIDVYSNNVNYLIN